MYTNNSPTKSLTSPNQRRRQTAELKLPTSLRSICRHLFCVLVAAGLLAGPEALAQSTGNLCIQEEIGGMPPCTANDVRIGKLEVISGPDTCILGEEITVTMKATIESGPDRYDIGIWINESGGSARSDPDGTCYRDYLPPPLDATTCSQDEGPFYNGEVAEVTDTCGDVYAQNTDPCGNATNNADCTGAGVPYACCTGPSTGTCVIRPCTEGGGDCLYTFRTFTVTIICADSVPADGIADVGTCTSWDNQVDDNCTDELGTDPGTGSKCSCSGDGSGIPVGEITICGNGIVEGKEECDPGDPVAGDCCDDSCMFEVADTPCEDGSFCTSSTGDPGDPDSCNDVGICTSIPVDCDDAVACTDDSCNETTDQCDNVANDGPCDDGLWCNGAETCDVLDDCQAGAAPNCDDGIDCTDDSCDEANDVCVNAPNDGNCDDGLWCNGVETCDATGDCQAGKAPDCDDGVACTDDACVEGKEPNDGHCENTANGGNCDDGDACTDDICDPIDGCMNPLNYDPDTECCDPATGDTTPTDDGDLCTADVCDPETGDVSHLAGCLDIKPSSCPNPVNPNSNGIVPVALIGSANFDVTQVDISTIELSRADGVGSSVTPNEGPPGPHTVISDVATPFPGELCDCHELSGDGIDDILFKFRAAELAEAFLLNAELPGTVLEIVLTGSLFDGTPIDARDCMVRIPVGFTNMNVTSNMNDVFVQLTPQDLNVDSDGFVGFGRAYLKGTVITLTAPSSSAGRPFLRWKVNGMLYAVGLRTLDVQIASDVNLEAIYQRSSRIDPDPPTEGDGDLE